MVIQAGRKIGILVEIVVLFESLLYHMVFSCMSLINNAVWQNHHFTRGRFPGNMFRPDLRLDVKVFFALLEGRAVIFVFLQDGGSLAHGGSHPITDAAQLSCYPPLFYAILLFTCQLRSTPLFISRSG